MTPRRPYTRDSIDSALMHHQLAGVVATYSPPEPPHHDPNRRTGWRISFANGEELVVGPATAHAVCVALSAAEAQR